MHLIKGISLFFILLSSISCQQEVLRGESSQLASDGESAASLTYSWDGVVELFAHDSLNPEALDGLLAAISTWNHAAGHDIIVYKGGTDTPRGESLYSSLEDDLSVVYGEEAWVDGTGKPLRTLGTTVWERDRADSSKIVRADVILNREHYYFQDSDYDILEDKMGGVVDAETVLLHELGHLLGLAHVSEEEDPHSIMNPYTVIGQGRHHRELSVKDVEKISSLYQK